MLPNYKYDLCFMKQKLELLAWPQMTNVIEMEKMQTENQRKIKKILQEIENNATLPQNQRQPSHLIKGVVELLRK